MELVSGSRIPPDYFSREDLKEGYIHIVGMAVAKLTLEKL